MPAGNPMDLQEYQDFEKDHVEDIIDIIDLGEKVLIKHRSYQKMLTLC